MAGAELGALAALVLVTVALFGSTLVGSQALFYRDVLHYYWETHEVVARALRAGHLPQWDPHLYMGLPLLGDIHAGIFYPPNLLYLVLSYPRAYAWLVELHLLIAGMGVFVLVRRLSGSSWGGLAGGLVFVLSGPVLSLHTAGALLAGTAYLPWVLAALVTPTDRLTKLVAVSALLILQTLCGDPQTVIFSLIAAALLLAIFRQREGWGLLGAGLILAGIICAVQLLPAWETLRHSTRAIAGAGQLNEWSTHPLRLLELLLPMPFGEYLSKPQFWPWGTIQGPAHVPFDLTVYLGASSLVFAIAGVRRSRPSALALGLIGAGLLLAMAPHLGLGLLLAKVPPLSFFRYPEKYLVLCALGWSLLVGQGWATLEAGEGVPRRTVTIVGGFVALLVLFLLWNAVGHGTMEALFQSALRTMGDHRDPSGPVEAARSSVLRALELLLVGGASVLLWRRKPGQRVLAVLPVAVLAVDLASANGAQIWTCDRSLYGLRPPVVDAMRAAAAPEPARFLRERPWLNLYVPKASDPDSLVVSRAWELFTLKSNLGGVFGLSEVDGYGALQLRRQSALVGALGAQPSALARLTGACFLLAPPQSGLEQDPELSAPAGWPELHLGLFQLKHCVPALHAVSQVKSVAGPSEALGAMRASPGQWGQVAWVEKGTDAWFGPAQLQLLDQAPEDVSAQVQAPAGGAYVVWDTPAYPGWTARIDDRPQPVERVNVAEMGAFVPPGSHRVSFTFRDPMLTPGLALTGLGLLAWAWLLVRAMVRRGWPAPGWLS